MSAQPARSRPEWSNEEIRRAIALSVADALSNTPRIDKRHRDAMVTVLKRLVQPDPIDVDEEGRLLKILTDADCELTPAFERGFVGQWLANVGRAGSS